MRVLLLLLILIAVCLVLIGFVFQGPEKKPFRVTAQGFIVLFSAMFVYILIQGIMNSSQF